jgi:N-acetylglucosamine repressor
LENGPISKVDIAEKLGLTLVTVNQITNILIKKGILVQEGVAESSGGRRAGLYAINAVAFYVIGINMGIHYVSIAIDNLRMETVYTDNIRLNAKSSSENVIRLICDRINQVLQTQGIAKTKLLGIGMTLPGLVDEEKGEVLLLPNMPGWENIPLKEILENEFQTYVTIEKDIYGSLIYLKNRKILTGSNAMLFAIKGGIGAAVLLNGKPYRGENGIAGEIGHALFQVNGDRYNYANSASFELYASDYGIINKVRDQKRDQLTDEELENLDLTYVINSCQTGDNICKEVLLEAAEYVGIMLSNAIKFYDPKCIIIYCRWIKEVPETLEKIENIIQNSNTLIKMNTEIQVMYQKDIYLEGAVTLVFEHMLESIVDNPLVE